MRPKPLAALPRRLQSRNGRGRNGSPNIHAPIVRAASVSLPRSRAPAVCVLTVCALTLAACAGAPGDSGGSSSAAVARDYLTLAMGYLDAGDLSAARHHLRNAAAHDAPPAKLDHVAALLAGANGEKELAQRHFRRAIRQAPNDSALRNNYGVWLYSQGRNEEALAQFRAALADESYPGRAHALENLGRTLLRRQRSAEALEAFSAALRLDGALPLSLLESALLQREVGDAEEAARLFDAYLRSAERYGWSHGPRALLAGAEFARESGEKNKMKEFGAILGTLYPETVEFRRYTDMVHDC